MLLGSVLQTAYVTSDLDRACALFQERFGIKQFLRAGAEFTNDEGQDMALSLAHVWVGATWLEIIQPISGAIDLYRDWLPKDGFSLRFHHVGIRAQTREALMACRNEAIAKGLKIAFSFTSGQQSQLIYVDTAEALGHYTEYLYFPDVAVSTMAKMPQNIEGYRTSF